MPDQAAMRYAFYGRVSTEDAQDPSLSIPRQLAACKRAIEPAGGVVETTSGMSRVAARTSTRAATAPTALRSV
jgi:hypothetical protein